MFFASKIGVGLDVDDLSLELVAAQGSAKGAKRVVVSRVVLEPGLIVNGLIKNEEALAGAIKRLLDEAQPKSWKPGPVIFGIPHSQFYPALVELAGDDDKKVKEEVARLAQENLPVAADDLLLDYKVVTKRPEGNQVLIVGVSRAYLLAWQKFLSSLGISISAFDVSAYALWRDLLVENKEGVVTVVDVGAKKSNVFIFNEGQLNYSYDFEIGGQYLTDSLAEKLSISATEAEDKKVKLGLASSVLPSLEIALYDFARELVTAITDYQIKTGQKVEQIKLVGGGAKLKGLVGYLEEKIPLPVSVGILRNLEPGGDPLFVEAGGLAMRAIDPNYYQSEPVFTPDKVTDKKTISLAPVKSKNRSEESVEIEDERVKEKLSAKFRIEKKLLLAIVIVGLVALAGAYWYRVKEKSKQETEQQKVVTFTETQSFPYKLVVAVEPGAYSYEVISGRVISDQIDSGTDYNQVLLNSRNRLMSKLSGDEELWVEPLNEVIDKSKLSYPLTLRWLAFNKVELLKLALAKVETLNTERVPYEFNSISKTKLEKTDSLDKLYLYGELTISLNQKINNEKVIDLSSLVTEAVASSTVQVASSSESLVSSTKSALEQKVVIGKTETGWLNARKGPGRSFEIVTKLYPGESYTLLDQQGEWWQVLLENDEEVWILARYAQKQ